VCNANGLTRIKTGPLGLIRSNLAINAYTVSQKIPLPQGT